MKKGVWLITIAISCCFISACKKASRYPIDISGEWISVTGCHMHISIKKDNSGHYYNNYPIDGCDGKQWKGKVRFTDKHLFVGATQFEFLEKPEIQPGTDSIYTDDGSNYNINNPNGKMPILATMTLKNSWFHHSDIIKYYKVMDY